MEGARGRGRAVAIALTAVATVVAALAVGALVVVLADRSGDDGQPQTGGVPVVSATPSGPALAGAPPTGAKLRDQGSTVYVNWEDPAAGTVAFMVTMAREGQQLRAVAQVGPGVTTTFVTGLNPKLEYCFAVVAVYSTNRFASSTHVCTERN